MPQQPLIWRDYQQQAIDAAIDAYDHGRARTVMGLPTGAGKTLIAGGLLSQFLRGAGYGLFLVPRLDLVMQTYQQFTKYFFEPWEVGIIQGETVQLGRHITIASKDTLEQPHRLAQYLEALGGCQCDCIVADESHLTITDAYRRIFDTCLAPYGMLLGPTATAYRSDGQSLQQVYTDGLCYVKQVWELIRDEHLADVDAYDVDTDIDPRKPWVQESLTKGMSLVELEREYRYTEIFDQWQRLAAGKRTLVFAKNLPDAYGFADYFAKRGIPTAVVTGKTRQREEIYATFRTGVVPIVCNFGVMTTGNDIKEIECILMARLTENLGLFCQMIGRGLRLAPHIGKSKVIVLNCTSKHHALVMFRSLFGTMETRIPSLRKVIQQKEQQEQQQAETLAMKQDLTIPQGQRRANAYHLIVGDGWTEDRVTQDLVKTWHHQGKEHRLIAEHAFAGGYRPILVEPTGHRQVLNGGELVSLFDAQSICQQFLAEQEHGKVKPVRNPDAHVEPRDIAYLRQRHVPLRRAGLAKGQKMTESDYEYLQKVMTVRDYFRIADFLKTHTSAFPASGQRILYEEERGVVVYYSRMPHTVRTAS